MLTKEDISQFQKRFNDKLSSILNFKDKLTDEEAKKLGNNSLLVWRFLHLSPNLLYFLDLFLGQWKLSDMELS